MDTSYLKLRHRKWSVQLGVPKPLQSAIGKKVLLKSTGTGDLALACQRKHAILSDMHRVLDAARDTIGTGAGHHTGITGTLQVEGALLKAKVRAGQMDKYAALEEFSHWLDKLDNIPEGTISTQQAAAIRAAGDSLSDDRATLSDGIKAYLASTPGLRKSTIKGRKAKLNAFKKWAGDVPMDLITRQQAGQYVTEVLRPSGRAASTIRGTIGVLGSCYRYCVTYSLCTIASPFDGLSGSIRDTSRGTAERIATDVRQWTDAELIGLLTSTRGNNDLRIMAILALYTGCRVDEIAEAELKDVYDTHFNIPEAKTKAGVRQVPWHPLVLPLVKHLIKTSKDDYLVSGLKRGGYDDKRHHLFAKRFSYHKINILRLPSACVFHGLRKNFSTQLVRHQVPTHELEQLIGHESRELVHNTYSAGVTLERLEDVIGMVQYSADVQQAARAAVKRAVG